MMPTSLRTLALETAECHRGTFYSWGGDDVAGFDCSGLVVEILKTCGLIPRKSDFTAAGLYRRLVHDGEAIQQPFGSGTLAFWGLTDDPESIYHVEMIWGKPDGIWVSIGASGGGSKTKTREDAIRDNAFIKVRPLEGRGGHLFFADPFI